MTEATARSILRLMAIPVVMTGLVGDSYVLLILLQLGVRVGGLDGLHAPTQVVGFAMDTAWLGLFGYTLISCWGVLLWLLSARLARNVVA